MVRTATSAFARSATDAPTSQTVLFASGPFLQSGNPAEAATDTKVENSSPFQSTDMASAAVVEGKLQEAIEDNHPYLPG